MRDEFERWYEHEFMGGLDGPGEWDVERNCYVVFQVHMAWKGYQAAYAAGQRAAWQPIETAPQDERETVLVSDGYTVGEAFWHDGSQCYGHRGKAGWFWEADRDSLPTASNAHATHWMPLPLPPLAPQAAAIRNRKEQA